MDSGTETLAQAVVLAQVRRQARKVHLESLAAAAIVTALFAIIP